MSNVDVEFEAYNQIIYLTRMCATIIRDSFHIHNYARNYLYIAFHIITTRLDHTEQDHNHIRIFIAGSHMQN